MGDTEKNCGVRQDVATSVKLARRAPRSPVELGNECVSWESLSSLKPWQQRSHEQLLGAIPRERLVAIGCDAVTRKPLR